MAEKNAAVIKALAIMKKNKEKRDQAGQQPQGDAGIPANMQGNVDAGIDEYGTDSASSGRAALEAQNNELAKKLAEKLAKEKAAKSK